jgi:hypothetical protein
MLRKASDLEGGWLATTANETGQLTISRALNLVNCILNFEKDGIMVMHRDGRMRGA